MSRAALEGMMVVEVGEGIASAYCGKLLAQYGANVIKVESPIVGDSARRAGPFPADVPHPEKSGLFHYLNTNKQGITLNLAHAEARDLLRALASRADALLESLSPGALDELEIGYDCLRDVNPSLVLVSITAFGQDGPYQSYRASDLVAHALGGWLYLGGVPDREPLKAGGSLAEYTTGLVASVGTMTALVGRSRSGRGQHVDVSSMEALLSTLPVPTVRYSFTGGQSRRTNHPYPFTILPCKDGYVGVNILTQRQWEAMCRFMGMEDWIADARFRNGALRQLPEVAEAITARISRWLMEHTQEEILEGQKERVPFALLSTAADLVESPQYRDRDFFVEVEHPIAGVIRQPGEPFKLSGTGPRPDHPAPTLGQHNSEVYQSLGYSKEDLVLLAQTGAI